MARLNGGWVMCSRAAARPKCRSSTTATKYCKIRNSITQQRYPSGIATKQQVLDTTPNNRLPGNVLVDVSKAEELAPDVVVIPNQGVDLVPNIGIIGGKNAVLVVETGMGIQNAKKVLSFARDQAKGRKLYLTTTHFHPEHAFGAQVFKEEATFLLNRQQAEDLSKRGPGYLTMFRTLGKAVATELEGVELATPDQVYDQQHILDLGNRKVELRATGQAHTKGDQIVKLPEEDIIFTGDLAEANQFAIFPWFPPHDTDVSGTRWLKVMKTPEAETPKTVVPGHGQTGGPQLLTEVRTYLELLRNETWTRRNSSMNKQTIIEEVKAVMLQKHPTWTGQDWIEKGVNCLCTEHHNKSKARKGKKERDEGKKKGGKKERKKRAGNSPK